MCQSKNEPWFDYRKCLITLSKVHEVLTQMAKVEKGDGGTVNM